MYDKSGRKKWKYSGFFFPQGATEAFFMDVYMAEL